jgi:hypothetical protein
MNYAERSSPTRLAAWALVGNLVMASAVFFEVLLASKLSAGVTVLPVWEFRLFTFGIPFLVGLAIVYLVAQKLRDGMKKGVWTDTELEPLRRRLRNPVWGLVSVALVILGVAVVVTARGFDHASLFCFLIIPFQTLLQIVQAVRPVENLRERIDWNSSATVRSDHWGESRTGTAD